MKALLACCALLALGACAAPAASDGGGCPIVESSDWSAWVNEMPGAERLLHVSGKVTVPTGGYRLSLERGNLREVHPPVLEVVLRAQPPSGGATQAIVTHDVTQAFQPVEGLGSVVVRCGSRTLATISPVESVH